MKEIYQVYSKESDMTFIMEDVFEDLQCISTEVIGFYWGKPTKEDLNEFKGKLKATFEKL